MKLFKASVYLSVLLTLGACSKQASVDNHLNKAKVYAKEQKTSEAVIELKNAIKADVNSGEARFLLGKIYLEQGDALAAVKELERATKLKYANDLLVPLLARAYILTDADDDVIALSDSAQNLKKKAVIQYLAYKTLAALRSEQVEIAQASALQAKSEDSENTYSKLAEAYVVFSENNFERAVILVKEILIKSSDNPDALMLQGQVATAMSDHGQAAKSFQRYLSVQPKSGIVLLLLADSLLKSEQYKKAELYADTVLAAVSTQPFAKYIKAMVRFQSKDYAKASEYAEAALSANFNQFNLKLVAGASAFYLNNWEQTNLHLNAIAKYLPPDHPAKKMLALSQLELGLINDINETLSDFSSKNESDSQFIASLSYKLLELGAVDEAKELVDKNINTNASNSARQGVLKLMMNDPSGMQDLKNAVKLNPELIDAELALAFASVQTGDIEQARKIAKRWEVAYPDKAGSANLMAMIYIKEKNFIKAEDALQESLRKEKDNIFALIELVNSARYQDKLALAKERANNLIILYPNNEKAQRLYFELHRNESAVELIISSYKRNKQNIKKALLASEALMRLEKVDDALVILNKIEQKSRLPKRYWQLLLLAYKQQRNENKMLNTMEQWQKLSPYHIEPSILLIEYFSNKRDFTRAISIVNRAFEYHPDNLTLQLVKMQLLLRAKEIYQAKELYNVLAKRDIKSALKMGLEGRILLLEKKFSQATSKLDSFYQAYSSAQNAIYLASAYQGNSQDTKAIDVLKGFLSKNNDDRVRMILASIYLNSSKDKAIESYEKVFKSQPSSVVVNNNLAWLYMEKGDLDSALKFSEKAISIAPDVANVVDTYSQILLKRGEKRDALKNSAKASELSNGKDIDIQLNYIETLLENSRKNEAKALLIKTEVSTKKQMARKSQLVKLL